MKGCLLVLLVLGGVIWFWNTGADTDEQALAYIKSFQELRPILEDADHVDVKTVEGKVDLRVFISSMMTYQPWMVTQLYRVRAVLVRLLGMKQEGIPKPVIIPPDRIPMEKGSDISFFKVVLTKEDSYWVAEARDKHLSAYLAVIVEPLQGSSNRFHVMTVVHYLNWTGPVYFNLIRPFHHLIVKKLALEGAKGGLVF